MRFYSRSVLIFSIIALFAVPVSAQSSWDGPAGLLRVKEAGTIGKGKLLFTLGTSYYRRSGIILTDETDSFYHLADPAIKDPQVDYNFFLSRAYFALGLSNHLEIAASLDVRNWIMSVHDDHANGELKNTSRGGIGDTGMEAKICLPLPSDRVKLGFLASTTFPTGNKERKFTTDASDYSFNGLFTLDLTDLESFVPTKLHINAGYKFNKNEDFGYGILNTNNPNTSGYYPPAYPAVKTGGNNNFNDIFQFGTGVEFILKNARLFLEFKWDDFLNANYAAEDSVYFSSKNLYTLTPGISLVSGKGVGILLALDVNVSDDRCLVQPPDWMAYFAFSMGGFLLPQDRDKDGIEDKVDKCIDEPEDFDGFEDDDGCPDQDNDADGIRDDVDQCPDLAEDNDGFQDEDGCPDLDNDGDGIPDVEDNCPGEPEDFDGFEDSDGCPDILQDSDNDGVPDDVDKCPLKQEDLDGFQDEDGCPDLDNDLDGILDADDQCPNEPETFNGYMDEDGCPDERPLEEKFILRGVTFESGSASLTPDSYAILDRVVKSLMAYPEVRIEIRGYTDSVGSWESNLRLSQRRADAVKQYLINSGIMADRILSRGYGEADPIAPNTTAAGRAENRRIEFHRLN